VQLSYVVTVLLSCVIPEKACNGTVSEAAPPSESLGAEHVAVQLLHHVLEVWSTPVNQLRAQTLKALSVALADEAVSITSKRRAVVALVRLGPEALHDIILPRLDSTLKKLRQAIDTSVSVPSLSILSCFSLQ
jgi:hypothetical protein